MVLNSNSYINSQLRSEQFEMVRDQRRLQFDDIAIKHEWSGHFASVYELRESPIKHRPSRMLQLKRAKTLEYRFRVLEINFKVRI